MKLHDSTKLDYLSKEQPIKDKIKIFSVKEITVHIKELLESDKDLINIWVKAEISNFHKHPPSGHMYFSLKDEASVLKCAMFKKENESLEFSPEHGMKVIVRGSISIYPPRGDYQLIVEEMHPEGMGNLHIKFLQLKNKLEKEGLFSDKHKKPLPEYPERIGIVTSISGAAIKDMLKVINQRFPAAEILISPATVQGAEAPQSIVDALRLLNRTDVDVIILGRGGGSLEDLWSFNEETVAREIFNSKIPIITGIGHEKDFTISDMVADCRRSTPSTAAERAVPNKHDVLKLLSQSKNRLSQKVLDYISHQKSYLKRTIDRPIFNRPFDKIDLFKQQVDGLTSNLYTVYFSYLKTNKQNLEINKNKLSTLNPISILKRGYSITMVEEKIVKEVDDIKVNDVLKTILYRGEIESKIKRFKEVKNGK